MVALGRVQYIHILCLFPFEQNVGTANGLQSATAKDFEEYYLLRWRTLRSITCCLRRRKSPTGYGLRII